MSSPLGPGAEWCHRGPPHLFWAIPLFLTAFVAYWSAHILGALRYLVPMSGPLQRADELLLWYSGITAMLAMDLTDLFVLLPVKRRKSVVRNTPPPSPFVTVALTAYNDEQSIGAAVEDFIKHPLVRRVIVIDNNSSDATAARARAAGADVVLETRQGYGWACLRGLSEGVLAEDARMTVLCEGDLTFRAADIDKLMAYTAHADIVCGTRVCEQLRDPATQLTTFMYYGNFFVGKLLEAKHLGPGTFSDVGTTYKLCHNNALSRLLPRLTAAVNLEFNAYFLDAALGAGLDLVECPVTFHPRIGQSKGGNIGNLRALRVGLAMIYGLYLGWPVVRHSGPDECAPNSP